MDYAVKTPTACFGIDLKHRDGEQLAPLLDFLLITHRHGDHYTDALVAAMEQAGKPVVSNFLDNGYNVSGEGSFAFGDVGVRVNLADHNATLPDFVVVYKIDCGPAARHCRIVHAGDACNVAQINPRRAPDLFTPHVSVGLDIKGAAEKIAPRAVLVSHLLELGHRIDRWRWSYAYAIDKCREMELENGWIPVWGEKIVWKK